MGFLGLNRNIIMYLKEIGYMGVAGSCLWELRNFRMFCYLVKQSSLIYVKLSALLVCIPEVPVSYLDLEPG
jgi:hypothetical protein